MKISHKKGFTLIELLVVIAIISLLSSIILAALSSARANARTGQREEELLTLRNALELYYDKNGSYPVTGTNLYESDSDIANFPLVFENFTTISRATNSGAGGWIPGLVADGDIGVLPHDPNPGVAIPGCGNNYYGSPESATYMYQSDNGTGYQLVSLCGAESPISSGNVFYDTWLANYFIANAIFPLSSVSHVLKICVPGNTIPNDCNGGNDGGWF